MPYFPPNPTDGDKGDITVASAGTAWSLDTPVPGTMSPGSFTIATGRFGLMAKRLTLTSSQRATVQGTGRLTING